MPNHPSTLKTRTVGYDKFHHVNTSIVIQTWTLERHLFVFFFFFWLVSWSNSWKVLLVQKPQTEISQRRSFLVFFCIPVSPGKSRLIWAFPRNFGKWINYIVPRWMFHIGQNLILDSDMYFLRVEVRHFVCGYFILLSNTVPDEVCSEFRSIN